MRNNWRDLYHQLVESLLDVLRAEIEVVASDWRRWAKHLAVALACFAVAWVVFLYVLELVIAALVAWIGARWSLPPWQASLIVAGLAFLLMAAAGLVGAISLKRVEAPTRAARRRFQDHVAWWQTRVLGDDPDHDTDETDAAGGDR